MAAPVRIEARAWSDIRFATLARLLGLADADHALIKVARLWSWQTEHFAADRPTYVLDADTIESVLGPGGPAALVRARLASEVAGGYRLHGTEGQIEWCGDLSSTRQQAGRARAAGARRDTKGRLLPRGIGEPDYDRPAHGPANVQQPSSSPPAQSSAPSPDPSPEDQISLSACARPPEPGPEPASPAQSFAAKDLARHRALGDLAEAIWTRLSTLRIEHAQKLGLEGTLPFPVITPGSLPRAFDELRARLREEGDNARAVADHVICVLDEQARTAKSIEWLSEKAFLERPWSKARETVLAKRKPPAAVPATPPVFMASDDDRAAAAAELAAFLGKETA